LCLSSQITARNPDQRDTYIPFDPAMLALVKARLDVNNAALHLNLIGSARPPLPIHP
jgi:hypothetical protein